MDWVDVMDRMDDGWPGDIHHCMRGVRWSRSLPNMADTGG